MKLLKFRLLIWYLNFDSFATNEWALSGCRLWNLTKIVPTLAEPGKLFRYGQAHVQWWHKGMPEKIAQRAIQAFELVDNRTDRYAFENTDAISVFKQDDR